MSEPILLAIETSQRRGGVAIRDRDGVVHVEILRHEARQDDDLLPAIDRLMTRLGLEPRDLRGGAVGVSIGPGGFTGLRIAVSTVKMFAETLDVRVAAVPSALAAAESYRAQGPILVALACKRETFWATMLRRMDDAWTIVDDPLPRLVDARNLSLDGVKAVLADEHLPEAAREACRAAGVPIVEPMFDPAACLAAADRMLRAGASADPLTLNPLYPREPEAVTIWNRRHASPDSGASP